MRIRTRPDQERLYRQAVTGHAAELDIVAYTAIAALAIYDLKIPHFTEEF
jgi:hypothetical protein